ncbi:hypothetical protein HNP46_006106 [Pseudomonas nitritireducens]|uniref:DUF4194 domain-containing protein n=1 Tax=Pseudomonas nitroreducens TaxID=46680 RepID=A0A7W7KRF5_PSENT|nr:hypothetical protein [Pseudomonas nitritireducens]MBB4867195.1 hypothetical protein [Pseudomonas nitritireducens]
MSQFARVVTGLIEGQFICQVTDREGFDFLRSSRENGGILNRDDVDQYLRRMGLRLASTRDGGAFFAAYADIDGEGKKAAKKRFAELKNLYRPMTAFLEMVMRLTGDDGSVSAGARLEVNRVMGRIAENVGLQEQLRQTAADTGIVPKDGSDRGRLTGIVKRFRDEKYLELINPETETYMFTGRIEWVHEAIEYIMLHEKISEDDSDFDKRTQA